MYAVIATILCMTVTANAQEKGVTLDFKNYEMNLDVLTEYVAALNASDAAKMNALFTENALIIGLGGTADTLSKKEHLVRYTENFKVNKISVNSAIYHTVKTDGNDIVVPGEYSFSWGTVTSMNKKTKKTASSSYHVSAAMKDGKIMMLWHYYDTMPYALRDGATLTMSKN